MSFIDIPLNHILSIACLHLLCSQFIFNSIEYMYSYILFKLFDNFITVSLLTRWVKSLSILGSTGSIGTQTLDIVRQHPDKFKAVALSCNSNIELLKKQIEEFKPEVVAVYDEEKADELKADIPVHKGMDGLIKA